MKSILFFLITVTSTACVAAGSNTNPYFDFLLNIKNQDQDELSALKNREKFYLDLREKASAKNADIVAIKQFLFVGFSAYNRNAASTMEALNTDMMLMYNNNSSRMLEALKELPFLIDSSCHYLGKYFGFEDKHINELPQFLSANKNDINHTLGDQLGQQCLNAIEKN